MKSNARHHDTTQPFVLLLGKTLDTISASYHIITTLLLFLYDITALFMTHFTSWRLRCMSSTLFLRLFFRCKLNYRKNASLFMQKVIFNIGTKMDTNYNSVNELLATLNAK